MASIAPTPQAAREERGNATIDDLLAFDGNAELVNGTIVPKVPAGHRHAVVSLEIAVALRAYSAHAGGAAYADGVGFRVGELRSGRESFSPDASWIAEPPAVGDEGLIPGPPTLAVEVRSPDDYSPAGLIEMAAKRADYFEAGTLAVWDVDPRAGVIHLFAAATAEPAATFARGSIAHAAPAMPGFTVAVDELLAG